MIGRLLALRHNDFVRHNVVFFIGSTAVSILNYLYHPVLSRMMSVEDFGETQALFSLVSLAAIPIGVFNVVALNLYANGHTAQDTPVRDTSLFLAYLTGVSTLLILCLSPWLTQELKITSAWNIIFVAGIVLLTGAGIFGRAHLQAQRDFIRTSLINLFISGGKLLCAVALVLLGYASMGAIAALFLATLATLLFTHRLVRDSMAFPCTIRLRLSPELRRELRFGFLVLCGTGTTAFFSTADVTIAKYLFSPEIAGLYAGVSIVARILFFATGSVAGVLLAHVTLATPEAKNVRLLTHALLITTFIAGPGLLILIFAPRTALGLLLGTEYAGVAYLLPILALHTYTISLLNVCTMYALALRKKYGIILLCLGVLTTLGFLILAHARPLDIALAFLMGSAVSLVLCLAASLVHRESASVAL